MILRVVVAVLALIPQSHSKGWYEFLGLLEVEAIVAVGLHYIEMAARLWFELSHVSLVKTCKADV